MYDRQLQLRGLVAVTQVVILNHLPDVVGGARPKYRFSQVPCGDYLNELLTLRLWYYHPAAYKYKAIEVAPEVQVIPQFFLRALFPLWWQATENGILLQIKDVWQKTSQWLSRPSWI